MAFQLSFDLPPLKPAPRVVGATCEERAAAFHDLNPWVLDLLAEIADHLATRGRFGFGAPALFAIARWEAIQVSDTVGDDRWLNNNFGPWYSRRLIATYPRFVGVISTRRTKAEKREGVAA